MSSLREGLGQVNGVEFGEDKHYAVRQITRADIKIIQCPELT
jgi:hypothetical protein